MKTKKNKNIKNKTKKHKSKIVVCNEINSVEDNIEERFKRDLKNSSLSPKFNLENYILKLIEKSEKIKIRPQDDFYTYVNELWLSKFKVLPSQEYLVKTDDFRLTQDKVYGQLAKLLKDYVKINKNSKKPFDISFIKFYKSIEKYFIFHDNDKYLLQEANKILEKIDFFIFNDKLLDLLAWINQNDLVSWGSPLIWKIQTGAFDPHIFRSYIISPKLTLIDISVYFDDGTNIKYKKIYREEYFSYLKKLFNYFFGNNHDFDVEDVFKVEQQLANAFACNKFNDYRLNYKFDKITKKDSLEKLNFDWEEYSKLLGFKNRGPEFFYTTEFEYLKCILKVLKNEWKTKEWRTYWIYIFIRMIGRFSDKSSQIYYNFNEIFQKGSSARSSFNLLLIIPISYAFNKFLSTLYVDNYKNENYINYAKLLSSDLKKVFVRILKRNSWLEPLTTKKKAIEKIIHTKIVVGYPDKFYPDPILDYDEDHIWSNMVKTSEYYHKTNVKLEGKEFVELSLMDWSQIPASFASNQTYNVNAFYTPSKNSIYIPLGYLQPPFIDLDQRIYIYNLCYIGLTIAHELAHALDEWGRQYDKNGKFYDWWTEHDKKEFYNIEKDIVKQVETYAARDGIDYDGWINVGELIADIVGFTIVREYLRDFLYIKKSIYQTSVLSFKLLYTIFALQFRQKINKQSIINEVKTNPHPLGKYRCNVVLSRSKIFRKLYNIKKGDGMWWPNTDRIWE